MISAAADLARRLARDAEAVCRHYLFKGRRSGCYWIIGDVQNTPGQSLYVRLQGPDYGPGAAGKWTDAATGEHGDLLDLIARNRNHNRLVETMDEARLFLALPRPVIPSPAHPSLRAADNSRILRSRPSAVSCRPPGARHAGRGLSARPRHHRTARLARAALSPLGLLPRRARMPSSNCGPRCSRLSTAPDGDDQRRSAHLARPPTARQGAAARSAPRARMSARQRCALWQCPRHPRRRRRHRDDAGAQIGPARSPDDCRALGQPSRRS